MFILANLHIIGLAVVMAIPFYFFNKSLVSSIRPGESSKRAVLFMLVVVLTALIYSFAGVLVLIWSGLLLK